MTKRIYSPSKRWPGYIDLPDPITYPQLILIQEMIEATRPIYEQRAKLAAGGDLAGFEKLQISPERLNMTMLPYLFQLVEDWGIEGMVADAQKFPAKPLNEANEFIDWWFAEVMKLVIKDEQEQEEQKKE